MTTIKYLGLETIEQRHAKLASQLRLARDLAENLYRDKLAGIGNLPVNVPVLKLIQELLTIAQDDVSELLQVANSDRRHRRAS